MSDVNAVTGTIPICDQCIDGVGGECHSPGCLFWASKAPDVPLRDKLESIFGCKIEKLPGFKEGE